MPSKNMLPKGRRRQSVGAAYRAKRGADPEPEAAVSAIDPDPGAGAGGVRRFTAGSDAAGLRLDAYLAQTLKELSRARVQFLIEAGQVRVGGATPKASHRLRGGETIEIHGEPHPEPLRATPEDIPLDILYEDRHLAVVNKPAGMMVHAGAGRADDAAGNARSKGTLVNALLHHMAQSSAGGLSAVGGHLRPGIVHRLDKQTSGAIIVAKDDATHRRLGELFSSRRVAKTYVALVHGRLAKDEVTVDLPIARDLVRRTRMTTRRADGRAAVSHVHVLERLETRYGAFSLVEVRIETGRTHQIRVHMQSLGHPVVGDTLYGAPRALRPGHDGEAQNADVPEPRNRGRERPIRESAGLERNFLHAAHLEFAHPWTGRILAIDAPLAPELEEFLRRLRLERPGVG